MSFFGSAGFEDGSVSVIWITNQSFGAFPTALDALSDWTDNCFRPPVGGMTELCTGIIICCPGTILSSGGVVTVWDESPIFDVATNEGITDVRLLLFGTEYVGTPSVWMTSDPLVFVVNDFDNTMDAWLDVADLASDGLSIPADRIGGKFETELIWDEVTLTLVALNVETQLCRVEEVRSGASVIIVFGSILSSVLV